MELDRKEKKILKLLYDPNRKEISTVDIAKRVRIPFNKVEKVLQSLLEKELIFKYEKGKEHYAHTIGLNKEVKRDLDINKDYYTINNYGVKAIENPKYVSKMWP